MKHVVMFYADWCGPCKMTKPILAQIERDFEDITVEYLNIDEYREEADKMEIKSIPTLVYYEDGIEYNRSTGYSPREFILKRLQ